MAFLVPKSVTQTEDALDFQAKLGEQGMAERREQQRRKDYVANQAYSLLCLFSYGEAIICCNSRPAFSQRFREETRRELGISDDKAYQCALPDWTIGE